MTRINETEVAKTIKAHLDFALRSARYQASSALEDLARELARDARNPARFLRIAGVVPRQGGMTDAPK